jgi:hypothetical protein
VDTAASRPPGGGLLRAAPAQKERPLVRNETLLLAPATAQNQRPLVRSKTLLLVLSSGENGPGPR